MGCGAKPHEKSIGGSRGPLGAMGYIPGKGLVPRLAGAKKTPALAGVRGGNGEGLLLPPSACLCASSDGQCPGPYLQSDGHLDLA